MIRAVIDTNILVSALLSRRGNEALVLLAIHQGMIRPCFNEAMAQECAEVLGRPKFDFQADEVAAVLQTLRSKGELIKAVASGLVSPDADDTKLIDCAVTSDATFLVTGNKRHFPERFYGTTEVISAGELLERLTLEFSVGTGVP